jgi:hypothetical protein
MFSDKAGKDLAFEARCLSGRALRQLPKLPLARPGLFDAPAIRPAHPGDLQKPVLSESHLVSCSTRTGPLRHIMFEVVFIEHDVGKGDHMFWRGSSFFDQLVYFSPCGILHHLLQNYLAGGLVEKPVKLELGPGKGHDHPTTV